MAVQRVGIDRKIDLIKRLAKLQNQDAKVGWFPSAVYENGTPVAAVAVVHEYGAPSKGIPPRPFFRPSIDTIKKTNQAIVKDSVSQWVKSGGAKIEQIMDKIAVSAEGTVRKAIKEVQEPALKPETIAARMRGKKGKINAKTVSKPLVDTGLMLATLTSEVTR